MDPRDDPTLVTLTVRTRHPRDYVLVNEADGTRWRGTEGGHWAADRGEDTPVELVDRLRDAARYLLVEGKTREGLAVQACVTMLTDDERHDSACRSRVGEGCDCGASAGTAGALPREKW